MAKKGNIKQPASEQKKKDPTISDKVEAKEYDLDNFNDILEIFRNNLNEDNIKKLIIKYIYNKVQKYNLSDYKIIFLYDEYSSISRFETDRIYNSIKDFKDQYNILLILNSSGGNGEPAYLLSKAIKKISNEKFIIAVPRQAKSAATLLSLGADEIHMGLMSELGPIDLQIGGYPALGLGNSLEYIAKTVSKHPKSSEMFSSYLAKKLELIHLGYLERLGESTVQYGERLIGKKNLPENLDAHEVARKLVYEYKDHSFVIDVDEANLLLGENIIKENTDEYKFSNDLYTTFDVFSKLFEIVKNKQFSYVGDIEGGFNIMDKPKK